MIKHPPIISLVLSSPESHVNVLTKAYIATGRQRSVINKRLIDYLKLKKTENQDTYKVNFRILSVPFDKTVFESVLEVEAFAEGNFDVGIDSIIGMDILIGSIFEYRGWDGTYTLSFHETAYE